MDKELLKLEHMFNDRMKLTRDYKQAVRDMYTLETFDRAIVLPCF